MIMLLDKYLLRRFIPPLLYCLCAFTMLIVLLDLFDHFSDLVRAKPSFVLVCRYYAGVLCPAAEYLVPAGLMLASMYVLWQLTRTNELIAMRASGISLFRIMLPFVCVGLVFSVLNSVIGTSLAPRTAVWTAKFYENKYQEKAEDVRRDMPYYSSAGHRSWIIGKIDLRSPEVLRDIKLTQERKDGTKARLIEAEKAEWLDGQWWFYNMRIQRFDEQGNPIGGRTPGPAAQAVQHMPFLTEWPSDFTNEAKPWEYYTTTELLRYLKTHRGMSHSAVLEKKYHLYKRLAMPWACLIVTLFGIPVGSRSARHSPLSGIFVAIGFFGAFYAVSQVGAFLAIRHVIATWLGAWLSNVAFGTTGIVMLIKMR